MLQIHKSSFTNLQKKPNMLCASTVSYSEIKIKKECDSRLHNEVAFPLQIPQFPGVEPKNPPVPPGPWEEIPPPY